MSNNTNETPAEDKGRKLVLQIYQRVGMHLLFAERGLSRRTIDALIYHGIKMPEWVLFMSETEIKKISGIGKSSLAEIVRYRLKFNIGN